MITWRLAVPAVLGAATVAACVTYLIAPAPSPPGQIRSTIAANRAQCDWSYQFSDINERDINEHTASKYGRRRNCLSASGRGYPEASAEYEGVRR